jgi:hypothetical protein
MLGLFRRPPWVQVQLQHVQRGISRFGSEPESSVVTKHSQNTRGATNMEKSRGASKLPVMTPSPSSTTAVLSDERPGMSTSSWLQDWVEGLPQPESPHARYIRGLDPHADHPLHPHPLRPPSWTKENQRPRTTLAGQVEAFADTRKSIVFGGGGVVVLPRKKPAAEVVSWFPQTHFISSPGDNAVIEVTHLNNHRRCVFNSSVISH